MTPPRLHNPLRPKGVRSAAEQRWDVEVYYDERKVDTAEWRRIGVMPASAGPLGRPVWDRANIDGVPLRSCKPGAISDVSSQLVNAVLVSFRDRSRRMDAFGTRVVQPWGTFAP
jgi:hypothetical protein